MEYKVTKPAGQQWNTLLDSVVTVLKYNKSTIDHVIYIRILYDVIVSYLTVFTDYFLNSTNNKTEFTELTRVPEEHFEMKLQEGYFLKYPNFRIF